MSRPDYVIAPSILSANFAKAGANIITFHPEASEHVDPSLSQIRDAGCQAGLVSRRSTTTDLSFLLETMQYSAICINCRGEGVDNKIEIAQGAYRVFMFDEVYPLRAAQEQAEKKKLGAFGLLAKLNPLNRPRENTVMLAKEVLRYEPLWHVVARREVDYACELTYPVSVHNPHAKSVSVLGHNYEVTRQGDKARIDVQVSELCHRKLDFDSYIDALKRDIKPVTLESYVRKYKFQEVEAIDKPEALAPLVPLAAVVQTAQARLTSEAMNAHTIFEDRLAFEKVHIYFRPVFAFEFVWSSADKRGVIEVDGLTGEIVENGQWFKERIGRVMTRDMLFEVGAEVAGGIVPGGGLAVKALARMTE